MLPKKHRLSKKKDFEAVFKTKEFFNNNCLVLKIREKGKDFSRFGIIVSKKVSKKAVVRNKIKRRIRGIIKNKLLSIKDGFDIVIITKKAITEKNYFEIQVTVNQALEKMKLLKNKTV